MSAYFFHFLSLSQMNLSIMTQDISFSQIKCKKASETGISILNEIIFTFHFTEHVTTKSKVRRKLSQLGLPN